MMRFAVIGLPVSQSLSPFIHAQFAEQANLRIRYSKITCTPSLFPQLVRDFFAAGGSGLNITAPFKTAAWHLCDELSERAGICASVNTLWQDEGWLFGDTTDGAGLVADLQRRLALPQPVNILLLGAGGAARSVALDLLQAGHRLRVGNRSAAAAEDLVKAFRPYGDIALAGPGDRTFDLVLNAASQGGQHLLPAFVAALAPNANIVDLGYGAPAEGFARYARNLGKNFYDGRGMLVEQAALSFRHWTGFTPDTRKVRLPA